MLLKAENINFKYRGDKYLEIWQMVVVQFL